MTRASNTILGLPVPKEPIDLDAPRTRRKRRTEAEETEMEEVSRPSGDVLPASNPESADKAASKQGRSKKKKTMNTPDVNHVDPAVSNTDMGAPPTDAAMTGSIAIGESIVPEGPPKKPRKKKATSTKPLEKAEAVDRGAPLQAAEVMTTVAGRVRNPSTLAKQVSKQASDKLLEREEKTRHKKEKAQRAVVVESLEATAEFVAATNGSSGAMATNANLKICPAQIPIAPGGLQHVRQNEANNLIAQRVANRLLSTAPPSSTASNSGSEPLNFTSNWHGQPYSRATSRAPSGSIAPSREVSVAPSTRSSHLSATRSGESRTVSSYPPTRPMSPASDISGEVNTMGLTLDERYAGIPPELAPRLPVYEPLPAPFHEPERLCHNPCF
ncbi:hypothetical protein RhiJN_13210 [Ceratobasidium sp. AG-Ba]|nr:hypothetical protein RhiJN_13210 [Ceratobasidium sp. AG-Ba]